MKRLYTFIFYNNGFTLLVLFLLLGTGTVLASNEEVRGEVLASVIQSEDRLVAVDNAYILELDLDTFDPQFQVLAVEEDNISYFVSYQYTSVEVVDGVWGEVTKQDVLTLSKKQLKGADLGLYVAEELSEMKSSLLSMLRETQQIEIAQGVQEKKVERKYAGLVGRFLDDKDVTFEGYKPVVKPPVKIVSQEEVVKKPPVIEETEGEQGEENEQDEEEVASSTPDITEPTASSTTTTTTSSTTPEVVVDVTAPVLSLNGASTIQLVQGEAYAEQGATAIDAVDGDVSASLSIVGEVNVDTVDTYTIEYTASDLSGNVSSVSRQVIVTAPEIAEPEPLIIEESEKASSTPG